MGLVNNQKAYDSYLIWPKDHGNIVVNGEAVGYAFQIRMPNFRGNYLSCIEELSFTLDGEPIDPEGVELLLNNKRFRIAELPELYKEYWDVNDCATIEVERIGGLKGKRHIAARMRLRYGYSAYFGACKVVTSQGEHTFDFGGGENA